MARSCEFEPNTRSTDVPVHLTSPVLRSRPSKTCSLFFGDLPLYAEEADPGHRRLSFKVESGGTTSSLVSTADIASVGLMALGAASFGAFGVGFLYVPDSNTTPVAHYLIVDLVTTGQGTEMHLAVERVSSEEVTAQCLTPEEHPLGRSTLIMDGALRLLAFKALFSAALPGTLTNYVTEAALL